MKEFKHVRYQLLKYRNPDSPNPIEFDVIYYDLTLCDAINCIVRELDFRDPHEFVLNNLIEFGDGAFRLKNKYLHYYEIVPTHEI